MSRLATFKEFFHAMSGALNTEAERLGMYRCGPCLDTAAVVKWLFHTLQIETADNSWHINVFRVHKTWQFVLLVCVD